MSNLKLGGTTFIIGKNGAGKSTLISALYLTKQLATKGNVDEILSKMAPFGYEIFSRGSGNSSCQIQLVVRDDRGVNYRFTYSIAVSGAVSYAITNESLVPHPT